MTLDEALTWIRTAQAGWTDQVMASWAIDLDGQMAGRMTLRLTSTKAGQSLGTGQLRIIEARDSHRQL